MMSVFGEGGGREQLVPTNHDPTQIQFVQSYLGHPHEVASVHSPVVSPHWDLYKNMLPIVS